MFTCTFSVLFDNMQGTSIMFYYKGLASIVKTKVLSFKGIWLKPIWLWVGLVASYEVLITEINCKDFTRQCMLEARLSYLRASL